MSERPLTFSRKFEAPMRSLRTMPESLKLKVWSKSLAMRKCPGAALLVGMCAVLQLFRCTDSATRRRYRVRGLFLSEYDPACGFAGRAPNDSAPPQADDRLITPGSV